MSEILTNNKQIILASSSSTRKNDLKKHFKYFISIKHTADELKIKRENQHLNYRDLVLLLAKKKAESVMKKYPKNTIIASDQILTCKNIMINKPSSIKQAKENLKFIIGKNHQLISAIYVIHNQNVYFKEVKEATLFFKAITEQQLDTYLNENNETVLTTVGSYKIEENEKYKFIKIISGDVETIKGFPLKNFLEKMGKR
jgi:septum formation protein